MTVFEKVRIVNFNPPSVSEPMDVAVDGQVIVEVGGSRMCWVGVAEQDEQYGKDLWARDPDLCCQLRKVLPMEESLIGYEAWITGLRVASSPKIGRAHV